MAADRLKLPVALVVVEIVVVIVVLLLAFFRRAGYHGDEHWRSVLASQIVEKLVDVGVLAVTRAGLSRLCGR